MSFNVLFIIFGLALHSHELNANDVIYHSGRLMKTSLGNNLEEKLKCDFTHTYDNYFSYKNNLWNSIFLMSWRCYIWWISCVVLLYFLLLLFFYWKKQRIFVGFTYLLLFTAFIIIFLNSLYEFIQSRNCRCRFLFKLTWTVAKWIYILLVAELSKMSSWFCITINFYNLHDC